MNSKTDSPVSLSTLLVHGGDPEYPVEGAVVLPIFQTVNFVSGNESNYGAIRYARLNNTPNHDALHRLLSAIENGDDALVLGSGMAAISHTLLALFRPGDRLLVQKTIYGGTFSLLHEDLERWGIGVDFIDAAKPESWKNQITDKTKGIYVETLSNPLLEVPDLKSVSALAKAHKLFSIIDNTFATPVNFRPLDFGFDVSLHSATKYLNGHCDVVAGAVIGRKEPMRKIKHTANHLGGMLDAHACFLLQRGLKTLELRMERQNSSALELARRLNEHAEIAQVHYAGLESSPSYARAKEYLRGFGGMLSFEVKGDVARCERFLNALKLPIRAASLGGVESLVIQPARSSHLGLGAEARAAAGIRDTLIRLSVGIEAVEDLWSDLVNALNCSRGERT